MTDRIYRQVIGLVSKASDLARSVGINNLLQPGLVKEMIIADLLGHTLIVSKRDADAHASGNPNEKYEYLSCKEGGSGQFDRMFKSPADKRTQSLRQIIRNSIVFLAVFHADNQTKCKIIYALDPQAVVSEAERQLDASANEISHVGLPIDWAPSVRARSLRKHTPALAAPPPETLRPRPGASGPAWVA